MDAESLYQQGVAAIRDAGDMQTGRRLLMQLLRAQPHHDRAWLWLARTHTDPAVQMRCVERALAANPDSSAAQTVHARLKAKLGQNGSKSTAPSVLDSAPAAPTAPPARSKEAPPSTTPSPTVQKRQARPDPQKIKVWLARAQRYIDQENDEAAIEQWVNVLDMVPDHDEALRGAIRTLVQLGFDEDASELAWRAIRAGTQKPSVYMTAVDIARRTNAYEEVEVLYESILELPNLDEKIFLKIAEHYRNQQNLSQAEGVLEKGLQQYPTSQEILMELAAALQEDRLPDEARIYYQRAFDADPRSTLGKAADKVLQQYGPTITARQNGSVILALRETAAFGLFALVLSWQDAGLDLLKMSAGHWLSIPLSLIGGYLLITATSSPQQIPIVKRLGGQQPETRTIRTRRGMVKDKSALPILSENVRWALGIVGGILVLIAFGLCFQTAIRLFFNPISPDIYF